LSVCYLYSIQTKSGRKVNQKWTSDVTKKWAVPKMPVYI